jgi:hypothetical protein
MCLRRLWFVVLSLAFACACGSDIALEDLREVEAERDSAEGDALEASQRVKELELEVASLNQEIASSAPRPEAPKPDYASLPLEDTLIAESAWMCSQVVANTPSYQADLRTAHAISNHCIGLANDLVAETNLRIASRGMTCASTPEIDAFDLYVAFSFQIGLLALPVGEDFSADEAATRVFALCNLAFGN